MDYDDGNGDNFDYFPENSCAVSNAPARYCSALSSSLAAFSVNLFTCAAGYVDVAKAFSLSLLALASNFEALSRFFCINRSITSTTSTSTVGLLVLVLVLSFVLWTDCITGLVETTKGVCLGSAKFKLLISAMVLLLTVVPVVVVVVELLLPTVMSLLLLLLLSGSCTLMSLSSGVGAFPKDCMVVVALPDVCIAVVLACDDIAVCLGSAKFKLLISAMMVLLTVVPVVAELLFSPEVFGSCTLMSLSKGVGALPDDCIGIVALPEDCMVVVVVFDVVSEVDEGLVSWAMVVPPAHVLLVLSSYSTISQHDNRIK